MKIRIHLKEYIEKQGSNYKVKSHSGKELGSYKTKSAAQKRLKQIEYFKHLNEDECGELDRITLSPEQVAKLHNVSIDIINQQLKLGIAEESEEHTSHKEIAQEIALDHLKEDPYYYSKLSKMGS